MVIRLESVALQYEEQHQQFASETARFSQWTLPTRQNTKAVFNHSLHWSPVWLPATLSGWQQHRNEDGAWFQRRWNNAKICPSLVQVEINDLIGSRVPPPALLASTYHIKETWVKGIVQELWLVLTLGWWERTEHLSFNYTCTEKQYNGHYFNKLFSRWGVRVAKACMCQCCHTVVSDRQQLRQMQLVPVETELLLKLEGGILSVD